MKGKKKSTALPVDPKGVLVWSTLRNDWVRVPLTSPKKQK